MLYRHKQGTFEVTPFKANYTAMVKQIVEDGIDEEGNTLYKEIQVEEQRESFVYDKELFEETLANSSEPFANLIYTDFTLTAEQQARYEEIRSLPESAIGSCIDYINGGAYPLELTNLQLGREMVEREINEIIMAQQLSEMEILILGGGQ